jgi:hypothetical protein
MKTKTKFQREMYELAGEFFALSYRADMLRSKALTEFLDGYGRARAVFMRANECAIEAVKMAESKQ